MLSNARKALRGRKKLKEPSRKCIALPAVATTVRMYVRNAASNISVSTRTGDAEGGPAAATAWGRAVALECCCSCSLDLLCLQCTGRDSQKILHNHM